MCQANIVYFLVKLQSEKLNFEFFSVSLCVSEVEGCVHGKLFLYIMTRSEIRTHSGSVNLINIFHHHRAVGL